MIIRTFALLILLSFLVSACSAPLSSFEDRTVIRGVIRFVEGQGLRGPPFEEVAKYHWQVINKATDIPSSGESDRFKPSDYQETVQPPRVEKLESGKQVVELYAWTSDNGVLSRWEVKVEDGTTITQLYAEVISVLVGQISYIRTEGYIPGPGGILYSHVDVSIPLP
jgi:hypothetical protein